MRRPPDRHHRRSIRLMYGHGAPCPNHCQPGSYFVTICTRDRECLFGEIVDEVMRLNEAGHAAQQCWIDIPDHFPQVVLDEAIIMPNHIHGIIVIHRRGEASAIPPHVSEEQPRSDASPLQQRPNGTPARIAIREYILGNPARWNEDENNPVQTDCGRSQTKATPWGT